jgi:hypothetical protein
VIIYGYSSKNSIVNITKTTNKMFALWTNFDKPSNFWGVNLKNHSKQTFNLLKNPIHRASRREATIYPVYNLYSCSTTSNIELELLGTFLLMGIPKGMSPWFSKLTDPKTDDTAQHNRGGEVGVDVDV